jgi:large subunit ribosomal protein L22
MEAIAKTRHLKGSPRKARLVIDLIRGRNVSQALAILKFTHKRAADPIAKCLRSAIANATNLAEKQNIAIDPDDLWVKTCFVDMGVHKNRRRMRPAPQGRAFREQRHYCHLTILVSSDDKPEKGKKALKAKTQNADGGKSETVEMKAQTPSKARTAKKTEKTGDIKPAKKPAKAKEETSKADAKETKEAKIEAPVIEEKVDTATTNVEAPKAETTVKVEPKKVEQPAKTEDESGDILETKSPKATKASKATEEEEKGTADASNVKNVTSQRTAERHETKEADERQLDENDILELQ